MGPVPNKSQQGQTPHNYGRMKITPDDCKATKGRGRLGHRIGCNYSKFSNASSA